MRLFRGSVRWLILALVCAVSAAVLLPGKAHALYRYFTRVDLARELAENPDKWLDKEVTFTDELVFVWPAGGSDQADGASYLKFDTINFRCAVPTDKKGEYLEQIWEIAKKNVKDILDKIEEVNEKERKGRHREGDSSGWISEQDAAKQRQELYVQLLQRWKDRPIVTVFGKVRRADFYGPVGKDGAANEVKTEALTIVVDRVEKPWDRYYEHGLDD